MTEIEVQLFQSGNLKERDYLKELTEDESTILKWILKKQGVRM
jgi:hypothetical protein